MKWTAHFITQAKITHDQTAAFFVIIFEDSALAFDRRDNILLCESLLNHVADCVNANAIIPLREKILSFASSSSLSIIPPYYLLSKSQASMKISIVPPQTIPSSLASSAVNKK